MYVHSHITATHGNLGLNFQRDFALPSLRIRGKLHHGYALAMVTLPKRCCGSVLSPWLLINPPSAVWSQQICSLRETFCCWPGVLTTCLCRLDSFQESDWSKARSNCAEVLHGTASSAFSCFFSFSLLLKRQLFRHYAYVCSPGLKPWTLNVWLWLFLWHCRCVVQ